MVKKLGKKIALYSLFPILLIIAFLGIVMGNFNLVFISLGAFCIFISLSFWKIIKIKGTAILIILGIVFIFIGFL